MKNIPRLIVELFIESGKRLAKNNPGIILKWTQPLENSESIIIQKIIIEIYPHLSKYYSDVGINWLLKDMNHFNFDEQFGEFNKHKWASAATLIKALSPHCSDDTFSKLEKCSVNYHEKNEKQQAKYFFQKKKEHKQYNDYFWGAAQYHLLPALASHRIQKSTANLIAVLNRKFDGYPKRRFIGISSTGLLSIGPKLGGKIEKINDKTWINIISNKKICEEFWEVGIPKKNGKTNNVSVWEFNQDFNTIAMRYPERFGRLALQLPNSTNSQYITSILNAMSLTKPGSMIPNKETNSWAPASIETISAVIKKFSNLMRSEIALTFTRMIKDRANEEMPNIAIDILIDIAMRHPDPEPEKLNITNGGDNFSIDGKSINILFQNSMNIARGVAAEAICKVLWHHLDLFDKLKPGIESLVSDPHPAVRMSTIDTLLPVLNIDRKQTMDWFCELSKNDPRIPASPHADQFFNYTIVEFHDRFTPLIADMINSNYPDVSERGAEFATAYHLFYGFFNDELELCRLGTIHQRKGVIKTAVYFIHNEKYSSQCRELIKPFFNDTEKEIRNIISLIFRDNFFDIPENIPLGELFVHSKTFLENALHFINYLENYKKSLLPIQTVIFKMCNVLINPPMEVPNDTPPIYENHINKITLLLLRLNEQSQEKDKEIANRCLDILDNFLEKRVGMTMDLIKEIEK